jgi:hypothetical protein
MERHRMTYGWKTARSYTDIRYELGTGAPLARQDHHRSPRGANAFRPRTLTELADAFTAARAGAGGRRRRVQWTGPACLLLRRRPACAARAATWTSPGFRVSTPRPAAPTPRPKPVIAMVAGFADRRRTRPARGMT